MKCSPDLLVFRIKTKDYCIQLAKAQGEQIGRKAPPPLFCRLVRYSAHIVAHDITSRTDISCIIEPHIGCDLAEKPPPPQDEGTFFDFRSIHFRKFRATLIFVAEKPPPP